jgi:magnesium transporter
MNFEHMPELGYRFAYPIALLVMFTATVVLYRFFKRIGWL